MTLSGQAAIRQILESEEGALFTFTMNGTISATLAAGLTEPDSGLLSDAVAIGPTQGGDFIYVTFGASEQPSGLCPAGRCIPETGQLQDLTSLLFPGGGAPFHVMFQSDISDVPEPGTVSLLGVGIASLAARRRSA